MIEIYQGDQFPLTFSIEGENGQYITDDDITEMIFSVGNGVKKYYSKGDITFNPETNEFTINLTIEDTNGLLVKWYPSQLRVFFDNDYVLSFDCGQFVVNQCLGQVGDNNE